MPEATRPAFINCARCGAEKKVGRSGPIPTYCSAGCRAALGYQRSREDGRYAAVLDARRRATAARQEAEARPCPYCGVAMTHPRRVQCGSADCTRHHYADRMRAWNQDYKERTGDWYHRLYAEAQREYNRQRRQELGHWRKLYPAAAAAADARRRMRVELATAGDPVVPADVHARDGWTCRLCGGPIDPEVAWPDPMSASVDHIVPLSAGGAHTMANVQSAHLGCNSRKRDRVESINDGAGQAV